MHFVTLSILLGAIMQIMDHKYFTDIKLGKRFFLVFDFFKFLRAFAR